MSKTGQSGVRFYCGIAERQWNRHPVAPGKYACIAPVYGRSERTKRTTSVTVPAGVEIIQDSGAFSDGPKSRLSIEAAHERQISHAERYGYRQQITHRASYDLLIDETWQDGKRSKKRWTWQDAQSAVAETIIAAEYAAKHRSTPGLILSAQGVTAEQYFDCAVRVMDYIEPKTDVLGLGGWCITGIVKSLLPAFEDTISLVIPEAARRGIRRVHVWGVIFAEALGKLLWMCDQYGIECSTDSVGPSTRPAFGNWGYADWTDLTYQRPPVEIRGLERARHVEAVRDWLSKLEYTKYYHSPSFKHHKLLSSGFVQLSLFDVEVA